MIMNILTLRGLGRGEIKKRIHSLLRVGIPVKVREGMRIRMRIRMRIILIFFLASLIA